MGYLQPRLQQDHLSLKKMLDTIKYRTVLKGRYPPPPSKNVTWETLKNTSSLVYVSVCLSVRNTDIKYILKSPSWQIKLNNDILITTLRHVIWVLWVLVDMLTFIVSVKNSDLSSVRSGFQSPVSLRIFLSLWISASQWWETISPKHVSVIWSKKRFIHKYTRAKSNVSLDFWCWLWYR